MTDTLLSATLAPRDDVPSLAARVDQLSGEGALDVFRRAMELERALTGELIDPRGERRDIVVRRECSGKKGVGHWCLREGS